MIYGCKGNGNPVTGKTMVACTDAADWAHVVTDNWQELVTSEATSACERGAIEAHVLPKELKDKSEAWNA